jgi:putative ABC transport system ATP-binding protein
MNSILETRGLRKEFGEGDTKVVALENVNLSLSKGEFAVVMGPSGCGKSTFLQIIGGLEPATNGQIFVDGIEIEDFSLEPYATNYRREKVGFVFQSFNLLSALTTWENVALPLILSGIEPATIKDKTAEMLNLVGLFDRRNHRPAELSGGQQQRVALARALINQPMILLADEPTGNLDSKTATEMINLLVTMKEKLSQTIILVTHDPLIATSGDRVILFRDGQVVNELKINNEVSKRHQAFAIMDMVGGLTESGV